MPHVFTNLEAPNLLCFDQSLVLVILLQLTRLVVGADNVLSTHTLAGIEQLVSATVAVGLLNG